MDKLFDSNHDGNLSDRERMDRDYFINETAKDSEKSNSTLQPYRQNNYNYIAGKQLGVLLFAIGICNVIRFPVFGLIVLVLGVLVLIS